MPCDVAGHRPDRAVVRCLSPILWTGQRSGGARRFLADRLDRGESVILLAADGTGFTQLYPCFSSVRMRMRMTLILNDLFVAPEARGRGVGTALLDAACAHARSVGAARMTLSTAVDNSAVQALYVRAGWERDAQFLTYTIAIG